MKREEITELIETRANERPDDEITLTQSHDVYLGDDVMGELRVEYKPREHRLVEHGLQPLGERNFFNPDAEGMADTETVVSDLYWALVDLLYPQSAYLEEPWTRLPLVVSLHVDDPKDVSDWTITLGTYR